MKEHGIFFLTLLFSFNIFSQHWPCGEDVHGVFSNIHMNCTQGQDILITSTQQETSGTIIRGVITTSGSISIIPGNTFVRIMANGLLPKGILTHGTVIGSSGNTGGRPSGNNKKNAINKTKVLDGLIIYPNPIEDFIQIHSVSNKIKSYQISNLLGKVLKKENLELTNKITLSVLDLNKGIYLLKIQLENGTQQIKTIIKN